MGELQSFIDEHKHTRAQAPRRHGRHRHLRRAPRRPEPQLDRRDHLGARHAQRDGAALHPGDQGRRQARDADRRQAGAALPGAHSEGRRVARQPRRRRARRGAADHQAPPRDRRSSRSTARQARAAAGRARRDRRLPHRGERHQPDLLPRDPGPDRLRRLRNVPGFAGAKNPHDRRPRRHPRQHRRGAADQRDADPGQHAAADRHAQRLARRTIRTISCCARASCSTRSTPATACW